MKVMQQPETTASWPSQASGVLLCAATYWEAAPVAKRLGLAKNGENTYHGVFAGKNIELIINGIGRHRLLKGLSDYETRASRTLSRPACCFSIGFAGALSANARPGDLVADLRGTDADWVAFARETAAAGKLRLLFGRIEQSEKILGPEEKAHWGSSRRACAVDMESGVLKEWSQKRAIAFGAMRVIYDGVTESLPNDLPEDAPPAAMIRFALSRPGRWLEFVRLGLRSRHCADALSKFIEGFLRRL